MSINLKISEMGRVICSVVLWFFILIASYIPVTYSQSSFNSESELKKESERLFEEDQFAEALPLFSQLLSLYPKDGNYNYKFGVCLMMAEEDKEKPLTYIEFASKRPEVDKEVFFYLGKAYHLNYRFADAKTSYSKFKKDASPKALKKLDVDLHIRMCENGLALLKNITDLVVLEKKELKVSEFFRAYDLTKMNGKLLVKPDEFKTPIDKKKKEESVIFLSFNQQELYISSYGKVEGTGKDIYKLRKLPDGSWSEPQNIGLVINTSYDEDYPYMHPDGKTLYFASKGHNSMGGYDVFKSEFNDESNTWSKPVNLDFAINTPDDDFLYICDSLNQFAYFSSKRSSPFGSTTIYKLKVDRVPVEIALIKGTFKSELGAGSVSASITVKNVENGDIVGIFSTNDKTGEYLINLPNGGKFMFTVESEGRNPLSELVAVPVQFELIPLRQEMALKNTPEGERLIINNRFDEVIMDQTSYMAALEFIKQRANLDVNYNEEQIKSNESVADTQAPIAKEESKTDNTGITNKELVNIAYEDAAEAKKEAEELKENADMAYVIANQKNTDAQQKAKEAEEILNQANNLQDPGLKQQEIEKANKLKQESAETGREAITAYNLAQNLERGATQKQKEADNNLNYANELDNAVKTNSSASISKLNQQKKQLENSQSDKGSEVGLNAFKLEADKKQAEADKMESKNQQLEKEIAEMLEEQKSMRAEGAKTKDKTLKQTFLNQADELSEEVAAKENELIDNKDKLYALRKEADELKQQADLVSNVLAEIKTSTPANANVASIDKQKLGEQMAVYNSENKTESIQTTTSETSANSTPQQLEFEVSYSNELKSSESNMNESERENARAVIYDKWSESLANEAIRRKDNLSTISDPVAKQQEADFILKIEQQSQEKKSLAITSRENAQKVSAVASTPTSSEFENYKTIQSQFETKINSLTPNSSELEQENAKAKIYDEWVVELDKEIVMLKDRAGSTTDASVKSNLENTIKELQSQLLEKQDLASASATKVANIKAAETASLTNTINNADVSTKEYNQRFESELNDAEKILVATEREKAKAVIYEKWTDAIQTDIEDIRTQLASVTEEEKKSILEQRLNSLETLQVEKKQNAEASVKAAETLKSQEAETIVAITPSETQQEVGDSAIASSNNVLNNPSTNSTPIVIPGESGFLAELKDADAIPNSQTREEIKAGIYKNWAGTIEKEIASLNEKAKETNDLVLIAEINNNIEKLKAEAANKNDLAAASKKNSENLEASSATEETPAIAAVSTEDFKTTEIKIKTELQTAEQISNEIQREDAKAGVYDNWVKNISNEIEILKAEALTTTDEVKKAELQAAIREMEKQSLEKQALASMSIAKAIRLKKEQGVLAQNSTTQASVVNESTQTERTEQIAADAIEMKFNEAAILSSRADSIRGTVASNSDLEARKALLAQAITLEQAARAKRIEAAMINDNFSAKQIEGNNNQLKELAEVSEKNQSDEIVIAGMLKGESELYFKEALKAKATAESDIDSSSKEIAWQRVVENEKLALEKQQKAKDLYLKSNPGYVITNKYAAQGVQAIAANQSSINNEAQKQEIASQNINENQKTISNNTSQNNLAANGDTVASASVILENKTNETSGVDTINTSSESRLVSASNASLQTLKADADRFNISAEKEFKLAETLALQSKEKQFSSQTLRTQSENESDSIKKNELINQADEDFVLSKSLALQSDSVKALAINTQATAKSKEKELALLMQSEEKANYEKQVALNNEGSTSKTENSEYLTESNELKSEIFQAFNKVQVKAKPQPKPIPINQKLPSGIIFKVQVGAFKNPISPDMFAEFAPLMGETTTTGITRYTAGLFKSFENANKARLQIKDMGYKDAFVVAFCNGTRIPTNEAVAMVREGRSCTGGAQPDIIVLNNEKAQSNNANEASANLAATGNVQIQNMAGTNQVKSQASSATEQLYKDKELEKVSGLLYTVQIGVYSNKVTSPQLYNIVPVYSEKTDNGYIRYTSGMFNNLPNAVTAKNKIVEIGVKDAFVTAYNNGKRIPVAEAKTIEQEKGASSFATSPDVNKMPTVDVKGTIASSQNQVAVVSVNSSPVIKTSDETTTAALEPAVIKTEPAPVVKENVNEDGVVFKVQIGAFKEEVPVDIAAMYFKVASKGIKHNRTPEGLTIYTAGSSADYEAMNKLKDEVIQMGLKDAFVVAYNKGQKITVDEAIELIKGN